MRLCETGGRVTADISVSAFVSSFMSLSSTVSMFVIADACLSAGRSMSVGLSSNLSL